MAAGAIVTRSESRTEWGVVHIDREILHNWSVDSVTKRVIALAAVILLIVGSLPLMTGVSGQEPKTALDYEVQELRSRLDRAGVDTIPTTLALLVAHQKIEDDRYAEQVAFEGRILWGFIGTGGGILMAIFVFALHQFGITIGRAPEEKRKHA